MISVWVVALAGVIASLGAGIYYDRQSNKAYNEAYNKGFHDAMAARIKEVKQKGSSSFKIIYEEGHDD